MPKLIKPVFILFLLAISITTLAEKNTSAKYIRKYKGLAIEEMKKYKIPASITMAQGILESGNGNSTLARKANNHFGIKCHKGWKGKKMRWTDDAPNECFRKYKSVGDSYRDHSKFLATRGRYSSLFKLKMTDYKGWARGLQKAGYATNKQYANLLIRIIEEHKLYKLDDPNMVADNNTPLYDEGFVQPSESNFEAIDISGIKRQVFTNNNTRFIFAEEGDDFAKIAKDLNIYAWQIHKYNDLNKKDKLVAGQMVYVQPKKRKASVKTHTVKENETLYSISQLYGVKLKILAKRNKLDKNSYVYEGQVLKLR